MCHKKGTETFLQLRLPDHLLKSIGQIDDLFRRRCVDPEGFAHRKWLSRK
ncbi:MAG: hypothetical protein OJF51_004700 [Nitrospira sp.]|nr:MAG: hypothetical protein OJF51_004700 [Nitrospira sp.]